MSTTKEERDELREWAENHSSPDVLQLLDERDELANRNVVDADWAHEEIKAGIAFRVRTREAEAEVARLRVELDEMQAAYSAASSVVDRLKEELADYETTFELRWSADMRAILEWQAAGDGRDMTWPDHKDLCVWLMEQVSAAQGREEKLKTELEQVTLRADLLVAETQRLQAEATKSDHREDDLLDALAHRDSLLAAAKKRKERLTIALRETTDHLCTGVQEVALPNPECTTVWRCPRCGSSGPEHDRDPHGRCPTEGGAE